MSPDLTLYIPTYKRFDNQLTLKNLPLEIARDTYVVVRPEEAQAHEYLREKCRSLLVLPPEVKDAGTTRQWAFDHCPTKYGVFMDDDLSFNIRVSPEKFNMTVMREPAEFTDMFRDLEVKAREANAAHLAVSAMEFNRRYFGPWHNNTRYMRFYMLDKEICLREKIDISRGQTKHDFDTALQLIRKGYPSWITYKYATKQEGSDTGGGCSEERGSLDPEGLKTAELLKSFHPEYIKIVKKKFKHSWGGKERWDVKISWAKAYRDWVNRPGAVV